MAFDIEGRVCSPSICGMPWKANASLLLSSAVCCHMYFLAYLSAELLKLLHELCMALNMEERFCTPSACGMP